ncbi:thioesterase/thiol ester dehydrase-isomerase [Plasmodium yoelii yoelii]|uniref:Thioesterase/thiol ester dehydrase-isomerase n=2 Tax=Plasmodium yoelii TaxID=5861 RepID=A0AAF0B1P2_PLAYO|nr:thioesterase/thiol ester dehydrase-isomerase [Plasmodium yoelii yoelii]
MSKIVDNKLPLKLETLNNDIFKSLKCKSIDIKKNVSYITFQNEKLNITKFEKACPLTFYMLKHKYKIDVDTVQIKTVKNNDNNVTIQNNSETDVISDDINNIDFVDSFIQFNIPVLNEFDRIYFYKHIIELVDTLAADVAYRHSIGGYRKNDKYNFVTVLFNNLNIYEQKNIHHEYNFSLEEQKPLTINCYIVYSGTTSYILKLDFLQENKLIFDIYTTFVNINNLTFKPQEVKRATNFTNNEEYKEISNLAQHIKDIQNLFNYKDIKNKSLNQNDINFMLNYFKNLQVQNKPYISKNVYQNTNIFEQDTEQNNSNKLAIIENILNKSEISFYSGKTNYYCKDSYVESEFFISSEYKNIHNFTFGGYLAYLSLCHAMTIIKYFLPKPILIEISEIQYILPVPYNSVVSYRGKIIYSDSKKIQIKISAYCFDFKKKTYYLTTTFDISFQNNADISFIPQSDEEIKLYLFSFLRSQLLS